MSDKVEECERRTLKNCIHTSIVFILIFICKLFSFTQHLYFLLRTLHFFFSLQSFHKVCQINLYFLSKDISYIFPQAICILFLEYYIILNMYSIFLQNLYPYLFHNQSVLLQDIVLFLNILYCFHHVCYFFRILYPFINHISYAMIKIYWDTLSNIFII